MISKKKKKKKRIFLISRFGSVSIQSFFLKNMNRIDYSKGVVTFANDFSVYHPHVESLLRSVLQTLGKDNIQPRNIPSQHNPHKPLLLKIGVISMIVTFAVFVPLVVGISDKSFHSWFSWTCVGVSLIPTIWSFYLLIYGVPTPSETYYLNKDDD